MVTGIRGYMHGVRLRAMPPRKTEKNAQNMPRLEECPAVGSAPSAGENAQKQKQIKNAVVSLQCFIHISQIFKAAAFYISFCTTEKKIFHAWRKRKEENPEAEMRWRRSRSEIR
jgi:hypothetical protein